MFDIGWSEMAIVFLIALIVIGPRDLPRVARTMGKWTGKARAMAREFQRSIDDMAREAEIDDIKKSINKVGSTDVKSAVKDAIDPKGEIEEATDMSGIDLDDSKPGPVAKTAEASGTAAKKPVDSSADRSTG